MENKHELSYETLTRVYLRSYEHYKSVGAGLELLEPVFELDDQEWVEMGSFLFDLIEQRVTAIMGYRNKKWGMSKNERGYYDQLGDDMEGLSSELCKLEALECKVEDDSKALVTIDEEDIDRIDYSKFTYGLKQTSTDESDSKPSEYASCESVSSVETSTSIPELVENASKVVCEPKVWTNAHIIEEYESDSNSDSVSNVQEDKEKPSFAFTDSVKHVKTSRENIKETGTTNHSPKTEKQDRNGHTRKGLGYAFTRKACFDDPHRALKDKRNC
nr:hypothetical protein [Tanacetum cinerariifolium]